MEDSFTKDRFHFGYWAKTLKNEVLKRNPQIILGFIDPDPVLLAKLCGFRLFSNRA